MLTVFGLKACDTCRKAHKELAAAGKNVEFQDVRETPLSPSQFEKFHAAFGEALLNKRSTTWRQLTEDDRSKAPIELLMAHPTLMKRPVIESEDGLTLGWDATAKSVHLGT